MFSSGSRPEADSGPSIEDHCTKVYHTPTMREGVLYQYHDVSYLTSIAFFLKVCMKCNIEQHPSLGMRIQLSSYSNNSLAWMLGCISYLYIWMTLNRSVYVCKAALLNLHTCNQSYLKPYDCLREVSCKAVSNQQEGDCPDCFHLAIKANTCGFVFLISFAVMAESG